MLLFQYFSEFLFKRRQLAITDPKLINIFRDKFFLFCIISLQQIQLSFFNILANNFRLIQHQSMGKIVFMCQSFVSMFEKNLVNLWINLGKLINRCKINLISYFNNIGHSCIGSIISCETSAWILTLRCTFCTHLQQWK